MTEKYLVRMTVNGSSRSVQLPSNVALLDALRDELGLTGSKECCGVGECGACTVSLDGQIVNSCLVLAVEADGATITTVEGLAPAGELSPLQQAFLDRGAVQCGFCIPGILMSAQAILDENPRPTPTEVRDGLAGNLCRCAGYARMFEAICSVAEPATSQPSRADDEAGL